MSKIPERRRRRTGAEIQALIGRYSTSRLTQAQFAAAEGVCLSTFSRYLRKARGSESGFAPAGSARFLEVELDPALAKRSVHPSAPKGTDRAAYRIRLRSGADLEVPGGFDPGEVATLLHLLSARTVQ